MIPEETSPLCFRNRKFSLQNSVFTLSYFSSQCVPVQSVAVFIIWVEIYTMHSIRHCKNRATLRRPISVFMEDEPGLPIGPKYKCRIYKLYQIYSLHGVHRSSSSQHWRLVLSDISKNMRGGGFSSIAMASFRSLCCPRRSKNRLKYWSLYQSPTVPSPLSVSRMAPSVRLVPAWCFHRVPWRYVPDPSPIFSVGLCFQAYDYYYIYCGTQMATSS